MVIIFCYSDACKESDWKLHSNMIDCTEEIDFKCAGLFPKPSPICSLYDDQTDQYIAAESFDRIDQLPNGTWEISINRKYHVDDYLEFIGNLSFKCYAVVLMTAWRTGITFKLFGDFGCKLNPPNITNAQYTIVGESTCWKTPKQNAKVFYQCDRPYELFGPSVLECKNHSWVPSMNQAHYLLPKSYPIPAIQFPLHLPECSK